MLGNKGNVGKVSAAVKPQINDLRSDLNAHSSEQNSFVNIDNTEKFAKLAENLGMKPKELRDAINKGNIDPKKLIEALKKVSKVPGVTIDKVKAQKELDKSQLGKTLDTVANQTGFKNFDDLINSLPENKTKGQTGEKIIDAVVSSGTNSATTYSQLKSSFDEPLRKTRLDQVGSKTNLSA